MFIVLLMTANKTVFKKKKKLFPLDNDQNFHIIN